ncbi:MAG: glycosyltransferase [Deltaproteobacteria bacterium]|nr:glycosyltransferase [Deltaproteobacteria bacterium]
MGKYQAYLIAYMKRKINILFVTVQLGGMGGSERLISNLALNLDRKIFNPSIAWFSEASALKDFKDLGIPLHHIPKNRRFDFSTMQKLGKIVSEHDIDIINAQHFMPMFYSFYGSKIMNKRKLIYTEHSEWEIERLPWRWQKMGSCLLSHADAVVGVHEKVAGSIQKKMSVPRSKTVAILNGVDPKSFEGIDKTGIRKKIGLGRDEKIIGMVANFKKIKNHIFLLRAFKEVAKLEKKTWLLLIGNGFKGDADGSEQEVREFIKNEGLDRVLVLGGRSDIPELLSIMDIFCLTSFKEGLPISLIEAMFAGLALVGTEVEGIKYMIAPDKNGYLVKIGDVEGLKNRLLHLLDNEQLRQRFGRESRSRAQIYSIGRCVTEYQNLFLSLMERRINTQF